MAGPTIKSRVNLVILALVLLGGTYYGIKSYSNASAERLEGRVPTGNIVQPVSSGFDDRLEERQSEANPTPEIPAESHRAVAFEAEPGLEAFQPAELYRKYVDEADGGNRDALYVLVTALDECRGNPTTTEEIVELERSGLAPDVLQVVKEKFQRCKPLYAALPNLEQEFQSRYEAVRDAEHPLFMVKRRGLPFDEKRQLVIEAISQDYPEPYLYARAYGEAAILYRSYPANQDMFREEAWLMLYCEVSLHCDSKKDLEYLRTKKYHAHEIDEILATYSSIAAAIQRKDWNALGL